MTLADLIEEARERVGDDVEPYKVSDARFAKFANQAQVEACRRARLLVDSTTEACCQYDVTEADASITLNDKVLFVRSARLASRETWLQRMSRRDLDALGSRWMAETGEVEAIVPDLDSGKLRLYRIPIEDDTLHLVVVRLPLTEMALAVAEAEDVEAVEAVGPELAPHHQMGLVHWMEHRYYSIRDEEIKDAGKAAFALAAFEVEFGAPATAIEERWAQEQYGYSDMEGGVYGA